MTKLHVLTGAPGSGKSSIVLALELMGEYVVREAAEDYIRYRQASGQKEPWKEADFQDKILDLQLIREAKMPKNINRIFLDRGRHDGLAWTKPETDTYKRIWTESGNIQYATIFFIEMLGRVETTDVRRENHLEAAKIGIELERIYATFRYPLIKIRSGALQERVEQIIEKIEAEEKYRK